MTRLYIARRQSRQALFLPMLGTRVQPMVIVPLSKKLENSELDELVQRALEKQGVPKEQWHAIIEQAEKDYERRRKEEEVRHEIQMRVAEQARFSKLRWGGLKPPAHRG